jgi:hypothetical protein
MPTGHRPQLQFSLKRLLVSTGLISVGLGYLFAAIRLGQLRYAIMLLPLFCAGPLICAGILHPFRLAWLGAVIGFLAIAAVLLYAVMTADI